MAWSMVYRGVLVLSIFQSCISCAPVISSEVRALLDPRLSYDQIARNPELYVGKGVLLAGTILGAKNLKQGTRLEVLQYPATRRGYPQIDKPAGGRFLVLAPGYLETEMYRSGRAITVAGDITGVQTLPLGETIYRYPTLISRELHLWGRGDRFPQLHFGFGVGFSKSF